MLPKNCFKTLNSLAAAGIYRKYIEECISSESKYIAIVSSVSSRRNVRKFFSGVEFLEDYAISNKYE